MEVICGVIEAEAATSARSAQMSPAVVIGTAVTAVVEDAVATARAMTAIAIAAAVQGR